MLTDDKGFSSEKSDHSYAQLLTSGEEQKVKILKVIP